MEQFKDIDKSISDLDEENDSITTISNELINSVTQIIHYLSNLHFCELSQSESQNLQLQQDFESLNQKYEHQR